MPTPLPIPPKIVAALAVLAVAGCQPNSPRPVPSVPQIGADLKCAQGDHGYEDPQAGWGFCYPGNWRYFERSQGSQSPPGFDLTFNVTYAPPTPEPCTTTSPSPTAPGPPRVTPSPCAGDFAFMIISTYERGGASGAATWSGQTSRPG